MFRLCLLCVTYLLLDISNSVKYVEAVNSTRRCGSVFLTVSSLEGSYIEMNWETNCKADEVKPDSIMLYSGDIRDEKQENILMYASIYTKRNPTGYHRSKTSFNMKYWPRDWELDSAKKPVTENNFPYWIVSYSSDDQIIDIQSLKLEPTWMHDNREKLKQLHIGDLIIPGTHDSGCYSGVNLFEGFILTQELPIWHQLVFGIRYLDLRIAYHQDGTFHINHDFIKVMELRIIYSHILKFVIRSPGEVVILDFHRFPFPSSWSKELHEKFINYTVQYFGTLILPRIDGAGHKGPTMEDIWKTKKNIILAYGEGQYVKDHPLLWNPIEQAWAEARDVATLKQYLENYLNRGATPYRMFIALMAELTPNYKDVIFRLDNLRTFANKVNRPLTQWVRDRWSKKANIVATDFFLGNNLIQVAIDVNTNK